MDEIYEEIFVDKEFLIELTTIQQKQNLEAADFNRYLELLALLQKSEISSGFTRKCIQEVKNIKKKLYDQSLSLAYTTVFPKVTRIFGSFLLQTSCKSQLYNDIIETWSDLIIPHKPAELHDGIVQNEDIFNKLFTKLCTLGHFLSQWDLLQVLLKYTTIDKALTSDDLLYIAKGPAYTRVRDSLRKFTTRNFDKHCIDILHKVNVDFPGDKLVIALTAIEGRFDNDSPIKTFKMDGVQQKLVVYFNLGKPGISCLCDPSTFDKNDNSESIHGYDIGLDNIKKITFGESPSMEIFQIRIRFLCRDQNGKKKLIFNFGINMKEVLMNSDAFEVLKIVRPNFSVTTASTNTGLSSFEQGAARHNKTILAFETTTGDETVNNPRMYVSDSDAAFVVDAPPQKVFYNMESNQKSVDASFQQDSDRDRLFIDESYSQCSSTPNPLLAPSQNIVNKLDSQKKIAEHASQFVLQQSISQKNNRVSGASDAIVKIRQLGQSQLNSKPNEELPIRFSQIVTGSSRNSALPKVASDPTTSGFQNSDRDILDEFYSQSFSIPNQQLVLSQNNVKQTDSHQKIAEDPFKVVLSQRISQNECSDSSEAIANTRQSVQSQLNTSRNEDLPITFSQMVNNQSLCSSNIKQSLPKVSNVPKTSRIQKTKSSNRLSDMNSVSDAGGKSDKQLKAKKPSISNAIEATILTRNTDSGVLVEAANIHLEKPNRYSQLVQNTPQPKTATVPKIRQLPQYSYRASSNEGKIPIKRLQAKERSITTANGTSSHKATTLKKSSTGKNITDDIMRLAPVRFKDTKLALSPNNDNCELKANQQSDNDTSVEIISTRISRNKSIASLTQLKNRGISHPARISKLVKNKVLRYANPIDRDQPSVPKASVIQHKNDPYTMLDSSYSSDERIKPIKRLQAKKSSAAMRPTTKRVTEETVKKATAVIKPTKQIPAAAAELALLHSRQPELNDLLNYSYRRQAMYNNINHQLRAIILIPEANGSVADASNEIPVVSPIANNTIPVAINQPKTWANNRFNEPGPSNNSREPATSWDTYIDVSEQSTESVYDADSNDENATTFIENLSIAKKMTSNRQFVSILRAKNETITTHQRNTHTQAMAKKRTASPIQHSGEPTNKMTKLNDPAKVNLLGSNNFPLDSTDCNDFVAGQYYPRPNRQAESGPINPTQLRAADQNHFQAKMLSESKKRAETENLIDRLKAYDQELEKFIKDACNVNAKIENDTEKLYRWALESTDSLAKQVQTNKQINLDMLEKLREFLVSESDEISDAMKVAMAQQFMKMIK